MGNTPNVRFKGFTEDWEQRKLEEVCSEIGDGLHSAPEYDDSGKFFFINGNNLINLNRENLVLYGIPPALEKQ